MAKKRQFSKAERKSFFAGLFAGLNRGNKTTAKKKSEQVRKKKKFTVMSGPRYLGPTCVNGKFYDTNWREPVEITKAQIKELRSEYDIEGKRTDAEVVSMFVHHMRRKYGVYDANDNFLYMLHEEDK